MRLHRTITFACCWVCLWSTGNVARPAAVLAAQKPRVEPQLHSLFPPGASQGSRSRVEVRAQEIEGAYEVWFDCPWITGTIESIEALKAEKPETPGGSPKAQLYRALLQVSVAPETSLGLHFVRIVSPRGVSNPLPFAVHQEPVVIEAELPKERTPAARRLAMLPIVVSGKIGEAGETDSYSFEAKPGQELFFEVLQVGRFDPQLSIYEPAGSWFDSRALRRLAFNDEPNTASKNLSPALSYRFDRKGRFVVTVGAFLGRGGPDCSYQLRIVPGALRDMPMTAPRFAHESGGRWQERSFARELSPHHLKLLGARAVLPEAGAARAAEPSVSISAPGKSVNGGLAKPVREEPKLGTELMRITENESKPEGEDALEIPLPALVEGRIDQPGDVDRFRFQVSDGARLAFEIETPVKPAPFLTPRLAVFDGAGQEVLNNIYAFVQGSGEFIEKVIEPKVTVKFERGGEYVLDVQELGSRNGGPDFRYRVLVRPQIPHVGRIEVASSFGRTFDGSITKGPELQQLNLGPGEARKITVLTEQEEGFDGQVALSVEGLPDGVEVLPATEAEPERARPLDEGKKERFRPGQQLATLLLLVAPEAPLTRFPKMVQLNARPVVNGKPGAALPVQTIPVMIVKTNEGTTEEADRRDAEARK